jgi:hypothetical protein
MKNIRNSIIAVGALATAAMIASGIDGTDASTSPDEGLGDYGYGGVGGPTDEAMMGGGVGGLGNMAYHGGVGTGTPGTKFTGPSLRSPLLETPGVFPLEGAHEYAFKSQRVFNFPFTNGGLWVGRYVEWWHRITMAATDKQGTFFNGQQSQFVTNIKNGEIPSGRPMWMQGMYIRPLDVAVADGSLRTNYAGVAATTTQIANQIALQKTLSSGVVTFTTNSGRDQQFQIPGVDRFVPGGGLDLQASNMSGTGLAAGYVANNMPSGGPKAYTGLVLAEPIPLLPGRTFSCVIDFQAATLPAITDFIVGVYGIEVVSVSYK